MKSAIRTGGLILLACLTSLAQTSITPTDDAVRESIRREAAKIDLRQRLENLARIQFIDPSRTDRGQFHLIQFEMRKTLLPTPRF